MCGHTPGKVAGRQETVKAEMNGLTPGLDRSPPPRWMGGQGGQSLKVFGRTRSFWGLSSPKIEMGGKALKWLSRLDYPLAKTGETVNGGAESELHPKSWTHRPTIGGAVLWEKNFSQKNLK